MLSTTSEYALRALVHLAQQPPGTAVLGRDLARATAAPANYLSKILLALGRAGLLETSRGAGGGYRLRRPAGEIFLIDVVEVFEGRRRKPTCLLFHDRECRDRGHCGAHQFWQQISMTCTGFLLTTSVAAIAAAGKQPRPRSSGRPGRRRARAGQRLRL